jgi:hypothetical protein
MSDANQAAEGTTAPAATDSTIATPPAAPIEPDWLPGRLDRAKQAARAEVLKELGAESLDAAKARIAAAKALEDSQKSELQRLNERIAALEPSAAKVAELQAVVAAHADAELAKLTEEQRAAVAAIAGDDKARALATVEALRPTWVKAAPAAPPPTPPAANTAAAGAAPTGAPVPTVNYRATWEALKAANPIQAAQYLERYQADIFPPQ